MFQSGIIDIHDFSVDVSGLDLPTASKLTTVKTTLQKSSFIHIPIKQTDLEENRIKHLTSVGVSEFVIEACYISSLRQYSLTHWSCENVAEVLERDFHRGSVPHSLNVSDLLGVSAMTESERYRPSLLRCQWAHCTLGPGSWFLEQQHDAIMSLKDPNHCRLFAACAEETGKMGKMG